ncbi:hypothetical protein [Eremococcus coleocola]|uniref:hypothetical protein n=1 Tax=Eremococcus coleocola TaxID=88132 RepID=UPI000412BFDF|nr:hypothetical protein [Eremococcus coleocola]
MNSVRLYKTGEYKTQSRSYCERKIFSCIKDGYLYALNYNNSNFLYKINIENPIDINKFDLGYDIIRVFYSGEYSYLTNWGDFVLGYKFAISKNDQIFSNKDNSNYQGRGLQNLMSATVNLGLLILGYGGCEDTFYKLLFLHTPYLETINNLSSPILKTADKTMKITYTLTEKE